MKTVQFQESYVFKNDIIDKYKEEWIKNLSNIKRFINQYIQKNLDKLSTRGPTRRIPFDQSVKEKFFDIVGTSKKDILKAVKDTPNLDPDWITASEEFNILCSCLSAFFITHRKPEVVKEGIHVSIFLAIRLYSISHYRFFKFEPNENIMGSIIDSVLSKRFLIKKHDTMFELFGQIVNTHSKKFQKDLIHNKFNDHQIAYFLISLNNRIKSIIKNIADVFFTTEAEKRNEIENIINEDKEGKQYIEVIQNVSTEIETLSRHINLNLISDGDIDTRILKSISTKNKLSFKKMENILLSIFEKEEALVYTLIVHIFSYYIGYKNRGIKDITSAHFIITMYNVYNISNTKNKIALSIKNILDTLIDKHISEYSDHAKHTVRYTVRSAIYKYLIKYIVDHAPSE